MRRLSTAVAITLSALVAACGSTPGAAAEGGATAPAPQARSGDQRVLMLRTGFPKAVKYKVLGEVSASAQTNSSEDAVLSDLADEARRLGADAVIQIDVRRRVTFLSYAAPTASGTAVKILDKGKTDLDVVGAMWK